MTDVYEAVDILFKFASINERYNLIEARKLRKLICKKLEHYEERIKYLENNQRTWQPSSEYTRSDI